MTNTDPRLIDAAAWHPVDTNREVEAAADLTATREELRDCIEDMLVFAPLDIDALSRYSAEVQAVAAGLLPLIVRVAKLREQAAIETQALTEITNDLVLYLDACAAADYAASHGTPE